MRQYMMVEVVYGVSEHEYNCWCHCRPSGWEDEENTKTSSIEKEILL